LHGRWFVVVGMVLFMAAGTLSLAAPQKEDIEVEDLKLGEQAILVSMAVASAELHGNQGVKGPGPNPFELGLAVIAARNSPRSLQALSSLVRFRFDGMFSEEYDMAVLGKGSRIEKSLRSLNRKLLHQECAAEFANLQKDKPYVPFIKGASEDDVCESISGIKEHVQELLGALERRSVHAR
jgi:hypothetical protein